MPLKDLLIALVVIVAWGVNFVVIKVGLDGLPPMLLGALRFLLVAFPAILLVRRPKLPWRWLIAYGATISLGQFAFLFQAMYSGMPPGLASLILQSQAFFTLGFAALFLGEKLGPRRIAGVIVAMIGALIIIRPGFQQINPGMLLALAAGTALALYMLMTRRMAGRDHAMVTTFQTSAIGSAMVSLGVWVVWQTPTPAQWGLFVALGFIATFGHYLIVMAYDRAEAITAAEQLSSAGELAYVTAWHENEGLGIATVEYPFRANTNEGTRLVDASGKRIDVDAVQLDDTLRADPAVQELLKANPQATPFAPAQSAGATPLEGGGIRLLYRTPLRDCHACPDVGQLQIAYDFDAKRNFIGQQVVPATP